ncbi:MAG TPA: GDSL-type esterase/lipase family protein [Mucilaginibacter sp.]|nr:GDSL-type esterase/lipase family protein [Mucilaginibacter sp.]
MKKYLLAVSILINLVFLVLTTRHFLILPKIVPIDQTIGWQHRKGILDKMPIDSNLVVFAGDSHIQQFELAELFHSLKVKNRGINSDNSYSLLKRVDQLTKGSPSKIFIEIGTNDLSLKVPADSTIYHIGLILKTIKTQSPRTIVYLQSVIPNKFGGQQAAELNKKIKVLTAANHLTFIDLDPYFLDNGLKKEYDGGDGIHLSGAGFLKWRDVLLPYVNE